MRGGKPFRRGVLAVIDDGFVQAFEAGAAGGDAYSKPMLFSTSSMKSEPALVWTMGLPSTRKFRISGSGGDTERAGGGGVCACSGKGAVAAAAPARAAPFSRLRRVTAGALRFAFGHTYPLNRLPRSSLSRSFRPGKSGRICRFDRCLPPCETGASNISGGMR
jgi:hypothetical protein